MAAIDAENEHFDADLYEFFTFSCTKYTLLYKNTYLSRDFDLFN